MSLSRKSFTLFFAALAMLIALAFTTVQAQQQVAQTIKPKLTLAEVEFTRIVLNSIEIRGNEVDAFMDVRGIFDKLLDAGAKDKKAGTDVVVVEMTYPQANNLLTLMQRAKMTGENADRFKKVTDTIVASAQADKK